MYDSHLYVESKKPQSTDALNRLVVARSKGEMGTFQKVQTLSYR